MGEKNKKTEGISESAAMIIVTPKVYDRLSHSLSSQFIRSAALFSRLAADMGKKHINEEETKISDYKAFVLGSTITAFSFIEATINELFWKVQKSKKTVESLGPEVIEALTVISEDDLEKISTLNKYQIALILAKKVPFDRGKAPFQNVELLRRLRNELIHYEPEWIGDEPSKLEEKLKSKFKLSPFMGEGSLFFPHKCLSHGCAEWAVDSSLKFVDDFNARMGLKPEYDSIRDNLRTR